MHSFKDMRFPQAILDVFALKKIERPTPIQVQGLPVSSQIPVEKHKKSNRRFLVEKHEKAKDKHTAGLALRSNGMHFHTMDLFLSRLACLLACAFSGVPRRA